MLLFFPEMPGSRRQTDFWGKMFVLKVGFLSRLCSFALGCSFGFPVAFGGTLPEANACRCAVQAPKEKNPICGAPLDVRQK